MAATSKRARACWQRLAWGQPRFKKAWARCNTHHGLTNAVLLPYIIVHNRPAIEPQLQVIARVLNLPGEPFAAVYDWVLALRKQLRIPHTLADIGVTLSDHDTIGHEASLDPSAGGNPLPTDAAAYARLFRSAVKGDLGLKG